MAVGILYGFAYGGLRVSLLFYLDFGFIMFKSKGKANIRLIWVGMLLTFMVLTYL